LNVGAASLNICAALAEAAVGEGLITAAAGAHFPFSFGDAEFVADFEVADFEEFLGEFVIIEDIFEAFGGWDSDSGFFVFIEGFGLHLFFNLLLNLIAQFEEFVDLVDCARFLLRRCSVPRLRLRYRPRSGRGAL